MSFLPLIPFSKVTQQPWTYSVGHCGRGPADQQEQEQAQQQEQEQEQQQEQEQEQEQQQEQEQEQEQQEQEQEQQDPRLLRKALGPIADSWRDPNHWNRQKRTNPEAEDYASHAQMAKALERRAYIEPIPKEQWLRLIYTWSQPAAKHPDAFALDVSGPLQRVTQSGGRDNNAVRELMLAHSDDTKSCMAAVNSPSGQANAKGYFPLHVAAMHGRVDDVRNILDNGCPVDLEDTWGQTALHHAAQAGQIVVVRLLLESGSSLL